MTLDVGIILPNYNYATLLTETVISIAASVTAPRMVTFVDDASTDDSVAVWNKAKALLDDKGIKHQTLVRSVNGGTSAALNTGIEATSTEWILPLATDDKLMPHALDELRAVAYAGDTLLCDHVPFGYTAFQNSEYTRLYKKHDDLRVAFQNGLRLSSGCSPFRRVFWSMCPFDETMRGSEDTAFWCRLSALGGRSIPSRKPCVWVRRHYGSSLAVNVRPNRGRIHQQIKTLITAPLPVDFMASESHFLDHLAPVWRALPFPFQGRVIIPKRMVAQARRLGVRYTAYEGSRQNVKAVLDQGGRTRLVVVCASGDQMAVSGSGHFTVFAEHGSGQTYSMHHDSYAGYPGRRNVLGFLCPGEQPARKVLASYRGTPVKQIGCPKLDEWQLGERVVPNGATVCISFHWDCKVCAETRNAWAHFKSVLPELKERFDIIGHAHPRFASVARKEYQRLGIEFVETFDEVLSRASVYVIDNSSTLFEFAAAAPVGRSRPVVVMNAPHYRRGKNHGMRFWEYSRIGINADHPSDLPGAIEKALLDDDPQQREVREQILDKVYAVRDGNASIHAANAILGILRNVPNKIFSNRTNGTTKAIPMNVKMQALVTFTNRKHEGEVIANSIFETSEIRAKILEKRGYAQRVIDPVPVIVTRPGPGPSTLKTGNDGGQYTFEATDKRGQYNVYQPDGVVLATIRGKAKAQARVDELNERLTEEPHGVE